MGRLKEITNRPANQPKTQKTTETRPRPAYLLWVVKVGEKKKYMGEVGRVAYIAGFGLGEGRENPYPSPTLKSVL